MPVKIDGTGYINSSYLGTANNIYTDGNGRVGIGTTSPANLLEVSGSAANIYLRSNDSGDATLRYMGVSSERATVRASSTNALYMETAGIERMRIDSSGRVTIPFQPMFYAYGGSTQSMSGTQSARIVQLPYQSTLGSRPTSYYDTTNYRFTAPIAGTYMFMMKYCITATSTGPESALYVNGSSQQYGAIQYSGAGYCTATTFNIWQCAASDYVEFRIVNNNTTSFTVDTSRSSFAGWLMG